VNEAPVPVFILSLPRAGSTLVQRLLVTQPGFATTAEPWILLPLFYSLRPDGSYAEYGHRVMAHAVNDFCERLRGGRQEFLSELRSFALSLYSSASPPGTRYFVDKTPRYHLIATELFEAFPDARFVFLWRNPLAVAASMVETWANGRWLLHGSAIDLFEGLEGLLTAHRRYASRAIAVRYEDVVTGPQAAIRRLVEYVGAEFDEAALEHFKATRPQGVMGDPSGPLRYDSPNPASIDRWQGVVKNRVRRAWCARYLSWIGPERLGQMGYSLDELRGELARAPMSSSGVGRDLLDSARALAAPWLEPALLRDKLRRRLGETWRFHPHR